MAAYIMALSINPAAKKDHPDLMRHINDSLEILNEHNIKIDRMFATLGRFDFLACFDTDDQQLVFKIATTINEKGILDTETWPVIPFEDFSEILSREI